MRHFLAGNFTVEQTRSEVLSSAILMKNSTPAFNEYMAPDPKADSGMHRYVYLLYVQPERLNKMGFDSVGVDEKNRKNFNVRITRTHTAMEAYTYLRYHNSVNRLGWVGPSAERIS